MKIKIQIYQKTCAKIMIFAMGMAIVISKQINVFAQYFLA